MNLKYRVGQFLDRTGYRIIPKYRFPQSSINLVALGFAYLRATTPETLTIVQVGAYDGQHNDPLQEAIKQAGGFVAVLVEPQPEACSKLTAHYAGRTDVIIEQAAITASDGPVRLYVPSDQKVSPKASLDPDHISRFGKDRECESLEVAGLSFESLLKRHSLERVDLLQIDAEGQDLMVLAAAFDAGLRPSIINVESHHLGRQDRERLREMLQQKSYDSIDSHLDTFAIRRDVYLAP